MEKIKKAFHSEHNRLFGYSLEDEGTEIEVINIRLRVIGKTEKPKFLSEAESKIPLHNALKGRRKVYIPEINEIREIAIYDGELSLNNNIINGPAVIEKVNTSIFVSDNYDCLVDNYGSFIVYNKEAYPDGFKISS